MAGLDRASGSAARGGILLIFKCKINVADDFGATGRDLEIYSPATLAAWQRGPDCIGEAAGGPDGKNLCFCNENHIVGEHF